MYAYIHGAYPPERQHPSRKHSPPRGCICVSKVSLHESNTEIEKQADGENSEETTAMSKENMIKQQK